jgi:hypothetical protein
VIPGPCTPCMNARSKNRTFLINSTTMDYSGLSRNTRIELTISDLNRANSALIASVAKKKKKKKKKKNMACSVAPFLAVGMESPPQEQKPPPNTVILIICVQNLNTLLCLYYSMSWFELFYLVVTLLIWTLRFFLTASSAFSLPMQSNDTIFSRRALWLGWHAN